MAHKEQSRKPRELLHLSLTDLRYTVPVAGQQDGKQLLCDINLSCYSGRLSAVMGPSGAGKTTLLNLLAGDTETWARGKAAGSIELNGHVCRQTRLKGLSAYVRQGDVLLATSTVRESLMFHTLLQLPRKLPYAVKARRVNEIIEQLGLQRCADTLIGDDTCGIKGISGGERRRVALGVELVKEPSILFLDEPTSGLDSDMAHQVVSHLHKLAHQQGRLVVFTIHQPNSDITDLFDDLLLLAPSGRPAYSGPWGDALGHFTALGYDCPLYKNPADYYIWLLGDADITQSITSMWVAHGEVPLSAKPAAALLALPAAAVRPTKAMGGKTAATGRNGGDGGGGGAHGDLRAVLDTRGGGGGGGGGDDIRLSIGDAGDAPSEGGASSSGSSRIPSGALGAAEGGGCSNSARGESSSSSSSSSSNGSHSASAPATPTGGSSVFGGSPQGDVQRVVVCDIILSDGVALPCTTTEDCSVSGSSEQPAASSRGRAWAVLPSWARRRREGEAQRQHQRPPIWYETSLLMGRCIRWWYRNPSMLMAEAIQYSCSALLLISIYPNMGKAFPSGAQDRVAAIFMAVIAAQFTAPARSVIIWAKERWLLRWEISAGAYRLPSYLLARMGTSLPLEALQVFLVVCCYYFAIGLQPTAAKFFIHAAFMVMVAMNASIVGHLVAVFAPDISYAAPLQVMANTVLCTFSGFLITSPPVYWEWITKISYVTYAYQGLVVNELGDLMLTTKSGGKVPAKTVLPKGFFDLGMGQLLGIMVSITIGNVALSFLTTMLVVRLRKNL